MIAIKGLKKKYPGMKNHVLKGIDFTFEDTGLYYIIGKSGSGKSTLLEIIGGMDFSYEGEVAVDNRYLKKLTEQEREDYRLSYISFAFQDLKADGRENVIECLTKETDPTDIGKELVVERIEARLKQFSLEHKKDSLFSELSGGEKKRISIIRSLLKNSPILLLDEPLSSLDKKMRKRVCKILQEESHKRLVIVITHDIDEIDENSTLLALEDGLLHLSRKGKNNQLSSKEVTVKRRKINISSILKSIFLSLYRNKSYLAFPLASLVIALFAISFSFLLSGSVGDSMRSALENYMDKGSMVIERKEEILKDTSYVTLDYLSLKGIEREMDEILAVTPFYTTTTSSIFKGDQEVSLLYRNKKTRIGTISIDSFIQYSLPEEIETPDAYKVDMSDFSKEEIVLQLKEETLTILFTMLFGETPLYGITDSAFQQIQRTVWYNGLTLRILASVGEWTYHLDHSLEVRDVVRGERDVVISPHTDFSEFFVTKIMHFNERTPEQTSNNPWTLEKIHGLRLKKRTNGSFLGKFLKNQLFDDYTTEILRTKPYYLEEDKLTHNRIVVYKDIKSRISVSTITDFASRLGNNVESVSFSSSVYTYTASGFISGFQKPFFFSRYKEKLNSIMDNFLVSDINLGQFQGTLIETQQGVLKADLLSSMEEEGVLFCSTDFSDIEPIYGQDPSSYSEIGISTKMAKLLFGNEKNAIGEKIHCLTLDRTESYKSGYKNIFSEGELVVKGVYDIDFISLVHESLFPLCYSFENTTLSASEISLDQAIVSVDLDTNDENYYLQMMNLIPSYKASFPMLSMTEEIESMLILLSDVFLVFSLLSLISSLFLFSLSLYLLIRKDRMEIGARLTMGYRKKEIRRLYFLISLSLGLIAFLLSTILTVACEFVIRDTLFSILSQYSLNILPYLISLLAMCIVSLAIDLVLRRYLKNLSPKDAFRS